MMRLLPVIAVLLAGTLPALADPLPLPRVDYRASYVTQPQGDHLTVAHQNGRLRVEMAHRGRRATGLMNLHSDRMTVLMAENGLPVAMDMSLSEGLARLGAAGAVNPGSLLTQADVTPTAIGRDVVAGLPCTSYRVRGRAGNRPVDGTVCLTPDNVLLAADMVDRGRSYVLRATTVRIAPQNPADFRVPAGMAVMNLDQMMQMLGGGLPGFGGAFP